VGFRYFVADCAAHLSLGGEVWNTDDRRVVCEAEGPAAAVTRLVDAMGRGPSLARVDSVDVVELSPIGQPPPFGVGPSRDAAS
jgi:acylphosphatase